MEKSPFFRPTNSRTIVVAQRTPPGSHSTTTSTAASTSTQEKEAKSTILGTIANLVNAIVGCGIVGIPFALNQSGFVAGIVLILVCAWITQKSLTLLICTAKHIHVPTYELLAEASFGTLGFRFVAINMFISAYGAMISYLMLIKDSFGTLLLQSSDDDSDTATMGTEDTINGTSNNSVFSFFARPQDSVLMRRTLLIVISATIMLPLSCQRDMAHLAKTSRWNVVIDTLLVGLVALNSPVVETWQQQPFFGKEQIEEDATELFGSTSTTKTQHFWIRWDTIFIGLGVLSFAFVCQHSAFLIAGSLETPTADRWSRVTRHALILCAILALLCGITGYLGFRNATQGNILTNLNPHSASANLARAMLGITMLFVYPLESFVARHVGVVLLFSGRRAHEGDDSHVLNRRDRRWILTTALYILAVVPAALATDLGPVLAITGSIGGSSLSYLGPGLVYLGTHGARFIQLARIVFGDPKSKQNKQQNQDVYAKGGTTEGTPLVGIHKNGKGDTVTHTNDDHAILEEYHDDGVVQVVGVWNHVLWYLTGMPLWCCIAKRGQARLKEHIHEMALKSPHPIRIGDVEYKRIVLPRVQQDMDGDGEDGQKQGMSRQYSMPQLHTIASVTSINQQIGQELLLAQQQQNETMSRNATTTRSSRVESSLEEDPQQEPPVWSDFIVAIGFILLGWVAMVAGIYSIFVSSG